MTNSQLSCQSAKCKECTILALKVLYWLTVNQLFNRHILTFVLILKSVKWFWTKGVILPLQTYQADAPLPPVRGWLCDTQAEGFSSVPLGPPIDVSGHEFCLVLWMPGKMNLFHRILTAG